MFKLLFCLCIIAAVYARSESEIKAEFMKVGMECATHFTVTPEEIQMLHHHKIPESENAKCLIHCVFKKYDWINDKGLYDIEAAHKMADKEHLEDNAKLEGSKKLFDFCKSVNDEQVTDGEKGCQRAALLSKCLADNTAKFGLKVPLP